MSIDQFLRPMGWAVYGWQPEPLLPPGQQGVPANAFQVPCAALIGAKPEGSYMLIWLNQDNVFCAAPRGPRLLDPRSLPAVRPGPDWTG